MQNFIFISIFSLSLVFKHNFMIYNVPPKTQLQQQAKQSWENGKGRSLYTYQMCNNNGESKKLIVKHCTQWRHKLCHT